MTPTEMAKQILHYFESGDDMAYEANAMMFGAKLARAFLRLEHAALEYQPFLPRITVEDTKTAARFSAQAMAAYALHSAINELKIAAE